MVANGVKEGKGGGFDALAGALEGHPAVALLRRALERAGAGGAWLVGGLPRDLALGRAPEAWDADVALPGSGEALARAVEAVAGGSAFPLDEAEGAWRVALPGGRTVDAVPLRAPTIDGDLEGRDFTVNAVAFDLAGGGLTDPLGGLVDLARGRLAPCSGRSLRDDPLRVPRAYRFRFGLGLAPVPGLAPLIGAAAPGLRGVSAERVRAELFALLGLGRGAAALRALCEEGVAVVLFPFVDGWRGFDQGDYHAHDLLEHSLRAAEAAEALAADPGRYGLPAPGRLSAHLAEALEGGVSRLAVLKLVAFLHDVAKPDTVTQDGARRRFLGHEVQGGRRLRGLLAELRVGRRARTAAQRVVEAHLRVFGLAHQERPTKAARLRYLRDLGAEVPEAVLLSLADERATGPRPPALAAVEATARELLGLFWANRDRREAAPLLRGRDLVDGLGLAEGPAVGEVLRRVAEAEAAGAVETRGEALALAARLARGGELGLNGREGDAGRGPRSGRRGRA